MRNDRKGAPAQNLVGQGAHQLAFVVARSRPSLQAARSASALALDMMPE
jgi:hypothetical protein